MDAVGSDRGPALVNSYKLRKLSQARILEIIRDGTPNGMPPFALPEAELQALAAWVHSLNASAAEARPDGDARAGERFFFGKGGCSSCHMIAGRGGTNGPDLSDVGARLTFKELQTVLNEPGSLAGTHTSPNCPGWAWCPENPWAVTNVRLRDGSNVTRVCAQPWQA